MQRANAALLFFNSKSAFDAAATTIVSTDFEGLTPSDTHIISGNPLVVDGVAYQATGGASGSQTVLVCGKDICSGNPHDSAVAMSNLGFSIVIDVTGLGFDVTALGGFFGDSDGRANGLPSDTEFSISLAGGGSPTIVNTTVDEFALGQPRTFFGVVATGGDIIEALEFDMTGTFEALDDMQFGIAGATGIPAPASLPLFAGALGLLVWRRTRSR